MNYLLAFIVGGGICAAVQILIDLTRLTPARILVGLLTVGVILYAAGLYDPIYEAVGCGVSIPLIGFGATVARGVREAVDTTGLIGALTGGLTASAAGISATLFLGFLLSLLFRGRQKRM